MPGAPEKTPQTFFKICGVRRGAETGGVLPTSPVFCAVVHLFVPPRFPLPLKTLILLGFLMFSYGNTLEVRDFCLHLFCQCKLVDTVGLEPTTSRV